MPIIGKLLKRTTALSVRIANLKKNYKGDQPKVLKKLLRTAEFTEFGVHYGFSEMLLNRDFIERFQASVPIRDYNQFYQTWLHRCLDDERNVIWPGRIKYFALSSGTTGAPSKRIPVSRNMIRSFQRNTIKQFSATSQLDLSDGFYQKSFLAIAGSSKPEKVGQHYEGDLSGILKKHTSIVLLPLTKPDSETASIKDWKVKIERMVEKAKNWDISTIAGNPTWCVMLMERVIEHYQVKDIHEIWPNLQLYVYGGVYIEPYIKRFEQACGKKVHILNTYLASEGYIAYQFREGDYGMQMLLKSGIFFEFVPFNRDNFDENGVILPHAKALTINEVNENEDYALVISTNAGLWRYLIGDLVRFTDLERFEIKISGRIRQYLSLVGEHLSLDNIHQAVLAACNELNCSVTEFCLYALPNEQAHQWFFAYEESVDVQLVLEKVDQHLCLINDDYASLRKYDTLKSPQVLKVKTNTFYQFMEAKGKLGSQNKFPRVMNEHQAQEWLVFLNKQEA